MVKIIFLFFCLYVSLFYCSKKSVRIIKEFFKQNQINVIELKSNWKGPDPFIMRRSYWLPWYYAKLQNSDGEIAQAYVKVGHWLFGLLKPIVHVHPVDNDGKLIERATPNSTIDKNRI